MSRIENTTGVNIQIGSVDFSPVKSLVLNDVLLLDMRKDTLLFCKDMHVEIDSFDYFSNRISISDILLDSAYFYLWIDRRTEIAEMNLDPILDTLFSGSGDSSWFTHLDKIRIRNSRFRYEESEFVPEKYGINWTNVDCRDVNADIIRPDFFGDTIRMTVENLSLVEKSGFDLKRLNGDLFISDSVMLVNDVYIGTELSSVFLPKLRYNWVPDQGYWRNFLTKMNQYYEVSESSVSFKDLAYFNSILLGINNTVSCNGVVSSTVDKLQGKNIEINLGNSWMRGDFESNGLPEFLKTKFNIHIADSYIEPDDLETIYLPWYNDSIVVPNALHKYAGFKANGNFNGYVEDFAFNIISSTPGLRGRMLFKYAPYAKGDTIATRMSGNFDMAYVDAQRLLNLSLFGGACVSGDYDFVVDNNGTKGTTSAHVNALRLNSGFVKNVDILWAIDGGWMDFTAKGISDSDKIDLTVSHEQTDDGTSKYTANGSFRIEDLVKYDLSSSGEKQILSTDIDMSYKTFANGTAYGECLLKDLLYASENDSLYIEFMNMDSEVKNGITSLNVASSLANMAVNGRNLFDITLHDINNMFAEYLPAVWSDKINVISDDLIRPNPIQLTGKIDFKEADKLFQILTPNMSVAPELSIYADIDSKANKVRVLANTDMLSYAGMGMGNARLELKGSNSTLRFTTDAEEIRYYDMWRIYNFRNESLIKHNTIDNKLSWSDWNGDHSYSGSLSARASFAKLKSGRYRTDVKINPGMMVFGDTVWSIAESQITAIDKQITIKDFDVRCGSQSVNVNGIVSENAKDSLVVNINEFVLFDFGQLFSNQNNLFGRIGGKVVFRDYYKDNLIDADLYLKDWGMDIDTLETLAFTSKWDEKTKHLNFHAGTEGMQVGMLMKTADLIQNKELNLPKSPFLINGFYTPVGDSLNFDVSFLGLNVASIQPYMTSLFTEMSGNLTGIVNISGRPKSPKCNGYIAFENVDVMSRHLRTRLHTDDVIYFSDSDISFLDFKVYDQNNQLARIDGGANFEKNTYDVNVSCEDFLILNSQSTMTSDMVYGKLYISGLANINNIKGSTDVDIQVKPSKTSEIYIPSSMFGFYDDNSFLQFVNKNKPPRREFVFRTNNQKMNLKADVSLNEMLKINLLFESSVGDNVLSMTGGGNLQVEMLPKGAINVYGDYNISRGHCLFTFGGMVNKNFSIRPGGHIMWNGSIYSGTIDVEAIYGLRASLSELLSASGVSSDGASRVRVECILSLSDSFMNPNVKIDLNFPADLSPQTRSLVQNALATEDEKMMQIGYLFIAGRFHKPEYSVNNSDENMAVQTGVTTVTELVSHQFSRLFSQISSDLDLDLNYNKGDDYSAQEVGVGVSYRNMSMSANRKDNSNMVMKNENRSGDWDFDAEFKFNENFKGKFYSRTDDAMYRSSNEKVQGVAFSYQVNVDSFGDLFKFLKRKKNKNKRAEREKKAAAADSLDFMVENK